MDIINWLRTLQILTSVVLSDSLTSRSLYNVALNKPTAQSTTFSSNGYEGSSWHAVDGVLDPLWANRSCASTKYLPDEGWWQVDLGMSYNISNVTIQNRLNRYNYLFNFKIEVAEDFENSTAQLVEPQLCYSHPLGGIGPGELRTFPCPDTTVGRFVRITRNKQSRNLPLTLCEVIVEVKADQCTNLDLALNKTATQSSTYFAQGVLGHAWRAVDGNLEPKMFQDQSCAHLDGLGYQWWQVDLGSLYHVKQVSIQNREGFASRLKDFVVEVSSTYHTDMYSPDLRMCYNYTRPAVPDSTLQSLMCPKNLIGRYVRISKTVASSGKDTLHFCEVIVEGGDPSCIGLTTNAAESSTTAFVPTTTEVKTTPQSEVQSTEQSTTTEVEPTTTGQTTTTQSEAQSTGETTTTEVELTTTGQTTTTQSEAQSTGEPTTTEVELTTTVQTTAIQLEAEKAGEHTTTEVEPTTAGQTTTTQSEAQSTGEPTTTEVELTTTVQTTAIQLEAEKAGEPTTTDVEPTTTEQTTTTQSDDRTSDTKSTTEVSTVQVLETSSQVSTSPPELCPCKCKNTIALQKYDNQTLEALVEELKEKLAVDKKQTSSHTRKLVSVDDGKTSSQNIGYVAVILLVAIGLTIVVPDVITLVVFIKNK